jgi:hypothetical protein
MTATYEQIEDEAHRRFDKNPSTPLAHYIIEVVREGWKPPEPVDPAVLAYREWEASRTGTPAFRASVLAGGWDRTPSAICFVAGFRAAREQEEEAAVALVEALRP